MSTTTSLFRSRRFLPIFVVQFAGALNDNMFRSAMLVLVAFQLTSAPSTVSAINNLAALLFILPYFLFSSLAGQLSDRSRKAPLIQKTKLAEIAIAIVATLALFNQSIPGLLAVLFLLGSQSAMFGPNKYALLPQLLEDEQLLRGNALVASGTFIAILLGTLIGGILAQQQMSWMWIGGVCVAVAVLGYLAARNIPETTVGEPGLKIEWNLVTQTRTLFALARQNQRIWITIGAISWFWFLGLSYLTQIPAVVRYMGGGDESAVTLLLVMFIAGVGSGCIWSARISGRSPELGIAPIALICSGLSGYGFVFAQAQGMAQTGVTDSLVGVVEFLGAATGVQLSLSTFCVGFFGGAYALPLCAEMQRSTRVENRARIISVNNILNAVLMVASSLVAIVLLGFLQLDLGLYLGLIATLNLCVGCYLARKIPLQTLRLLAQFGSRLLYRIDAQQMANLPTNGGALLVCNHLSYADAVILFGASKRPIRFLMDAGIQGAPFLRHLFDASGAIALCSPLEDQETYTRALATAAKSLHNGDLLLIFPEGQLSPDGALGPFHRGFEKILEQAPVPVYPLGIHGLWGSFLSHANGPALKTVPRFRLSRRKVTITVGHALTADQAHTTRLRQQVRYLLDGTDVPGTPGRST